MGRLMLASALATAALALPASPASAQLAASFGATAAPGGASVTVHRNNGANHERRGRSGPGQVIIVADGWGSSDGWALYNNRAWEPDSFNDWWHDRPDRAYPRWVLNNQNCDRMWWGGGVWRCGW